MYYAEKYNKEKIYYFQDGKIADYERLQQIFPAIDDLTFIVFTDYSRQIIISFEILNLVRTRYNISTELTDDQAIAAIIEIMNNPDPEEYTDTTRIADALEDLVVLNMPDEEVE
jgi:hypothetical protein